MKSSKTDFLGTWHDNYLQASTYGDRLADIITRFVGSWLFLSLHGVWFALWIVLKLETYPYGLLTMILSLEAIFLSTFILISQNRQSDRDRHQALADFRMDSKSKEEIEKVRSELARVETEKINKILRLLEK
jgi:uncharacterized membrane protein